LWRIHCITRDRDEPLAEDFFQGFKKMLYVLGATIIQGVIFFFVTVLIYLVQMVLHHYHLLFSAHLMGSILTFLIFFAQGILIFYVVTLFLFMVPLIAIENKGILSAIRRSFYLVWNHWWRVFSFQLFPWFFYLFALLLIRFVFKININIYFIAYGIHSLWPTLLQIILFTFFIPWVASVMIVQIRDLELRKHLTQKDKNAV
jgi:hypothetical protein